MKKDILFFQGGGDSGYEADRKLVASLQHALGKNYGISYPELKSDESLPDFDWLNQIGGKINEINSAPIIVAHSLGASRLLKFLSERSIMT